MLLQSLQVDSSLLTETPVIFIQRRCLCLDSLMDAFDAAFEKLHMLCVGLNLLVQEDKVLAVGQRRVEGHSTVLSC